MEGRKKCFDCAALGSCPFAGEIAECKLYMQSRVELKQIAKLLGVSDRTITRNCKYEYGVEKIIEAVREVGIRLVYDKDNHTIFYRKVNFEERVAQLQVNTSLGAILATGNI